MRLGASRLPLLLVAFALPGCPLGIETGYMVDDGAAGNTSGSAGAAGTPISGGSGGSSPEGGAPGGGVDSGGGAGTAGSSGSAGSGGNAGSSGGDQGGGAGLGGEAGMDAGGSAGNGGSGGAPGCEATCDNTCCDEICIDTMTSAENCGTCGNVCPLGRTCSAGKCTSGWLEEETIPNATARTRAAHVWTGTHLFVWGGQTAGGTAYDGGFLYNPTTGEATSVSMVGAPSARILANAVWLESTGQVLVWGGSNTSLTPTYYASGALYDPADNTWAPVDDAPDPRRGAVGIWAGTRAIFYGGRTTGGVAPDNLLIFDPANPDPWSVATQTNEAPRREHFAWGWTGTDLYLFGGIDGTTYRDSTFRYNVAGNTWEELAEGKGEHYGVFGAWNGSGFLTWGGRSTTVVVNSGSIYTTSWAATSTTGAPSARQAPHRETGWTANIAPNKVLILGGRNFTNPAVYAENGAIHEAGGSPQWTAVPSWPSGENHAWGVGQWTGKEFLLWGGGNPTTPTATLDRWAP